ncbi:hypothetical protein CsSME_00037823 [Camellia sinensis var. sinensis]
MKQYARGFLMFVLGTTFHESFTFFQHYFDIMTAHEIMWQCWAMMPGPGPLLTVGLLDLIVSMSLPESMRIADNLSVDEVTQFMVGLDVDYFRVEGDYTTFIQTYLMPPLIGARGDKGGEARMAARATGARARGAPREGQRTHWPELPTALTCWQHTGAAYQVPIEPAAADHEHVEICLLQTFIIQMHLRASIEYTGSALELIASLMGMVQRRETLLGLYDPSYTECTGGSSSSSTKSQHSESSESGDDGAGSGFESEGDDVEAGSRAKSGDDASSGFGSETDSSCGVDKDSALESSPPRKRTKRASRA